MTSQGSESLTPLVTESSWLNGSPDPSDDVHCAIEAPEQLNGAGRPTTELSWLKGLVAR